MVLDWDKYNGFKAHLKENFDEDGGILTDWFFDCDMALQKHPQDRTEILSHMKALSDYIHELDDRYAPLMNEEEYNK